VVENENVDEDGWRIKITFDLVATDVQKKIFKS